uniref:DNA repair protein RecO n=1 Tax=Desulfacinum infernum TaxID=35837 RepID=A0A831ZY97_9BACT
MMVVESEAVVLCAQDYGESDRIVTFFSVEWGLVRAMAKGARRSRKRFVHAFEPNSVVQVGLRQRRALSWVESCRLVEGHLALRSDPLRWAYAGLLVETTLRLNPENLPNPTYYVLLRSGLARLGTDRDPANVAALFLVRAMRILGALPSLERCCQCGRTMAEASLWRLSLAAGRFSCGAHSAADKEGIDLDKGAAALLQAMLQAPVEKIWRFRLRKRAVHGLIKAVCAWVEDHTGQSLKSRRLLHRMETGPEIPAPSSTSAALVVSP